jgi:uncharacterized protein
MQYEKKQGCPFEIKAVEEHGIFEGYASVFNNEDLGGDIVMPGAFKKAISDNLINVPILWGHNTQELCGKNLEAKEDRNGLFVKGELNLNTQRGREAYEFAKQGAIRGLSIGYSSIPDKTDRDSKGRRLLREVKWWEYSLTPFPMNEEALITDVKEFSDLIADIKAGRTLSAANVEALRAAIADGETAVARLRTLLEVAEPPAEKGAVHPSNEPNEEVHSLLTQLHTVLRG